MIKLKKNLFKGDGVLTQRFGENPQAYAKFGLKGHNGIDYGIKEGTELYSAINGTVIESRNDPEGYGEYIKIENSDCGVLYGHRKAQFLAPGDKVCAGDLVGYSGNTGNSTGAHLHFGVFPIPRDRSNGYAGYIDPLNKDLVEWVDELEPCGEIVELKKKVASLEEELTDMRDSRNSWRSKAKAIEELYTKETAELIAHRDILIEDLKEANARIEVLEKAMVENKTPLSYYTLKERLVSILDTILKGDK